VVENRAGAGGTTGANDVAKAAPDGYTILQATNGQAISPAIYKSLPFDALRDFIPVTQVVATSTVLVTHPKFPARTPKELIALAKAKPGGLNYGMTGVGNSLHLTMEMFKRAAGIDLQPIPYRGDAPLNTALIAGEVDVAVVPLAGILPAVSEEAIPGFEESGWQGWFVPAKTPPEAVALLQREIAKIVRDPATAKRLIAMGNDPVGSPTDAFATKFRNEVARFGALIKEAGIPQQ
jgi:tripartite-type tricarboxylate transporter receptor subunit TctC